MFFLIVMLYPVFGCRSFADNPNDNNPQLSSSVEDPFKDKNLPDGWGGFQVPPELEKKWKDWLAEYKRKRELELDEDLAEYRQERGPGSGWPASWMGLGGGFSGAEPPPWAYMPVNIGLPDFCYQPPKNGSCDKRLTRWAFNPYISSCVEFQYTGCFGNQNNFLTMEKCEQSCMKMPENGCDPKKKQYVEAQRP